eukprot:361875-Chlamydomonas_euryale.AAC.13
MGHVYEVTPVGHEPSTNPPRLVSGVRGLLAHKKGALPTAGMPSPGLACLSWVENTEREREKPCTPMVWHPRCAAVGLGRWLSGRKSTQPRKPLRARL